MRTEVNLRLSEPQVLWPRCFDSIRYPTDSKPQRAHGNHHYRKPLSIQAIRRKFFCSRMKHIAIPKQSSFGKLVERIDANLDQKKQQEYGCDLKESPDVN